MTQEVLLRAWRGLPALRAGSVLESWLWTVTRNAVRSHLRQLRVETLPLGAIDDAAPDTVELTARRELQRQVRRAIGDLDANHRVLLELHELEGWEVAELARALRIPVGTVKSRLCRGRARLRTRLELE